MLFRSQDWLLSERISRSDLIVACGGGVTTDLVGYAAATILRGVSWGAVPTTLIGMVDAGIGGKIAASVGRRLKKLSRYHQVLAVTHLAQIAAFADNHIKVEKFEKDNKTWITVEKLDEKSTRILEISRMLSGDLKSDTSLKHAEELLQASAQS